MEYPKLYTAVLENAARNYRLGDGETECMQLVAVRVEIFGLFVEWLNSRTLPTLENFEEPSECYTELIHLFSSADGYDFSELRNQALIAFAAHDTA